MSKLKKDCEVQSDQKEWERDVDRKIECVRVYEWVRVWVKERKVRPTIFFCHEQAELFFVSCLWLCLQLSVIIINLLNQWKSTASLKS